MRELAGDSYWVRDLSGRLKDDTDDETHAEIGAEIEAEAEDEAEPEIEHVHKAGLESESGRTRT